MLFCTNVPVICELCPPIVEDGKQLAVWKYNMRAHMLLCHSEHAVPGWPAQNDIHDAQDDHSGLPIPFTMASALNFGNEESRLGLAVSTRWTALTAPSSGSTRPAASASLTRSVTLNSSDTGQPPAKRARLSK
jgi:hypothetical protein